MPRFFLIRKRLVVGLIGLAGLAFSSYGPLPNNTDLTSQTNAAAQAPVTALPSGLSVAAIGPKFESGFPIFQVRGPEITWAATMKGSQAALWVYHVVPQHFSPEVISNLMAMGSFTWSDEKRGHRSFSTINDDMLFFFDQSRECNLSINPSQGWIEYWNGSVLPNHWDKIKRLNEPVVDLPSESQVEKLGLRFIKQFGISRSDLAQNANGRLITFGTKQTRSYFDRATKKYIEDEPILWGIFFNRRIDGLNFAGIGMDGGCEIDYSSHAKISKFSLEWRNLQPYERHAVASRDEIVQWVQEGKAVLTHKNLVNPADVKKLTITDISFLYMGASREQSQDFVYPFAQLEAVADLGNTNVAVQLYCPVLTTNVVPAVN